MSSRFLTKIFAAFAATIVLTAVVVGWLEADSIEKSVRDRTIARLREQAVLLAEVAAPYLGRTEYDEAFQARIQELGRANRTRFTVIREDGSVIADSEHSPLRMQNHRERPEVSAVLEGSNDHVVERAKALIGEL